MLNRATKTNPSVSRDDVAFEPITHALIDYFRSLSPEGRIAFLFKAVEKNYTVGVNIFLKEFEISPNQRDKRDATLLHLAAQKGCLRMAALLISLGAEIDQKEYYGGATPLRWARKNPKMIGFLLDQGADPTVKDIDGDYPLLYPEVKKIVAEKKIEHEKLCASFHSALYEKADSSLSSDEKISTKHPLTLFASSPMFKPKLEQIITDFLKPKWI